MDSMKKRKVEADNDLPKGEKTYEELEAELLETKRRLAQAEAELKKRPLPADNDSDFSDDDEGDEPDPKDSWVTKFLQLREYRIINGNCAVPLGAGALGQWVNNQRRAHANVKSGKKGLKITPERIAMLDWLGFNWGKKFPAPVSWDERFEELKKYQKAVGHCNIALNSASPSPIAKWVSTQRSEYRRFKKGKDSLLTLDQIGQLKEIGFNWKGPRTSPVRTSA